MENILEHVCKRSEDYLIRQNTEHRQESSQYFTPLKAARYMASLYKLSPGQQKVRILDPGAGTGILSVALIEMLEKAPSVRQIEVVCYETDAGAARLLKENLTYAAANSSSEVTFRINRGNFILRGAKTWNTGSYTHGFDVVISNPPFKKLVLRDEESQVMEALCQGGPNLYVLFVALSITYLKDGGQGIFITPRSWTSGAYFRRFRHFLMSHCSLTHLHFILDRTQSFADESVRQETMIYHVRKSHVQDENISVTSSRTAAIDDYTEFSVPVRNVVYGENQTVRCVTTPRQIAFLNTLEALPERLENLGIRLASGTTVRFRHQEYLRTTPENAAPLIRAQHIREGRVVFPQPGVEEYVTLDKACLVTPACDTLIFKRFTTKEERRRIQCALYLKQDYPNFKFFSTDNMVTFLKGEEEIPLDLLYGLYVIFNSRFYDECYRLTNGSTQVNVGEINAMRLPSRTTLVEMGRALMAKGSLSESACDAILQDFEICQLPPESDFSAVSKPTPWVVEEGMQSLNPAELYQA